MSKYNELWKYIYKSEKESISLSFDEIKEIIGIPIDHSFLTYKKELFDYGFFVKKISKKEQMVVFNKLNKE